MTLYFEFLYTLAQYLTDVGRPIGIVRPVFGASLHHDVSQPQNLKGDKNMRKMFLKIIEIAQYFGTLLAKNCVLGSFIFHYRVINSTVTEI
jgi:hypothetical protein